MMKKLLLICITACFAVMAQGAVIKSTAGYLLDSIKKNSSLSITDLVVGGELNAYDFAILRDSLPYLTNLDLGDASVVAYTGNNGPLGDKQSSYPAKMIPPSSFYRNGFDNKILETVILPASVEIIGYDAFMFCKTLKKVTIRSNISKIESGAFMACLDGVDVDPNNTHYSSVNGILYNKNQDTLIQCPTSTTSISFPAKLTGIGSWAFGNCALLNTINLPEKLKAIPDYAFYGCKVLTVINIPASVETIGRNAFEDCVDLTFITVNRFKPISLLNSPNVFLNVPYNCSLIVPYGSSDLYRNSYQWKNLYPSDATGFMPSTKILRLGSDAGSKANFVLFSNSSYGFTTTSSMNSVSISQFTSYPDTVIVTAEYTNSTSNYTYDTLDIIVPYINTTQKVLIIQDIPIVLRKPFDGRTITNETVVQKYVFSEYFSYPLGALTYSVSTDNPNIVTPIVNGKAFGLVPYHDGTTTITVSASSGNGSVKSITFDVTVINVNSKNCDVYLNETIDSIKCAGDSSGAIVVSAKGATFPVNYKWSNTRSDSANTKLTAGTYSVVAIDAAGCVAKETYVLTEPKPLVVERSPMAMDLMFNITGGTPPYTRKFSNGDNADMLYNMRPGAYDFVITDANGCKEFKTFGKSDYTAPEIYLDTIQVFECAKQRGLIGVSVVNGTPPYDYIWSNGAKTEDIADLKPGVYSLTVSDANKDSAVFVTTIPARRIASPSIALVTVSDSSHRNLIVWQKEKATNIGYYTIYRENAQGEYKVLDIHQYNNISVYVDRTVDPYEQSWRYKLSATDACGYETPKSLPYKTMHLKKTVDGNKVKLRWDDYEGAGFFSFAVERQRPDLKWELLKTLPANVRSYTDTLKTTEVPVYHVAVLFDTIRPSLFKTDTGPFSQSLSNMSEASLVEAAAKPASDLTAYPNPAQGSFTLNLPSSATISLVDVLGHQLINQVSEGQVTISTAALAPGMYYLHIANESISNSQTIIVK